MIGVRILRLAATAALSAALAGCGVVSDAPLFNPEAAPRHRLAEGLWAMSGPGCEVAPNVAGDLPDCAAPVTVAGGKMSWDVRAYLAHTMGVAAQSLAPSMLPKTTAFVQVDGDPQILELLNQSPDDAGLAQQPSYLAMKVLQADPAGRIVRGIIWPVSCPPPGRDLPPGMRRDGVRCVATTPAAIQSQSKAPPPPFQSFFLTWISPKIDRPAPAVDAPTPEPPRPPPRPIALTSFVFEEVAGLAPVKVLGETSAGRHQSIPITGGTVSGPGFSGTILPGGADDQLVRPDGSVSVDADYRIETDDHVVIHVHNVGVIVPPAGGQGAYAWATPTFEAPAGRYGWLNAAIFVSRISRAGDADHPAVRITIWKVG